jgi:hypothetical protein
MFVFSLTYFLLLWSRLAALNSSAALFIVRILIIIIWLAGITYKTLWYKSNTKKFKTILLFIFFIFISIPIVQSVDAVYNVTRIYQANKKPSNGWKGRVHEPDNRLGYKPIPNATGLQVLRIGDGIPMKYDENGFRVPLSYNHDVNKNNHPRILFLGCSFTYGASCLAEETFPFLVEKELNGYSINAGACSYGLSQMYLLAQTLIPKYKPDYVVFQHSSWLVLRSLLGYIPAYHSCGIPAPYFDKDNQIIFPLFQSHTFQFPTEHYKLTKKSFGDYLSFLRETFPLYMKDVYRKSIVDVKQFLHLIPKPSKNNEDVERYVIREVNKICKQNNSKMIILDLSWPTNKYKNKSNFLLDKSENLPVAKADSCMYANLGKGEKYEKKYYHYRMSGKDSVMVDPHPNPPAEKIIAAELIRVIDSLSKQNQ